MHFIVSCWEIWGHAPQEKFSCKCAQFWLNFYCNATEYRLFDYATWDQLNLSISQDFRGCGGGAIANPGEGGSTLTPPLLD